MVVRGEGNDTMPPLKVHKRKRHRLTADLQALNDTCKEELTGVGGKMG